MDFVRTDEIYSCKKLKNTKEMCVCVWGGSNSYEKPETRAELYLQHEYLERKLLHVLEKVCQKPDVRSENLWDDKKARVVLPLGTEKLKVAAGDKFIYINHANRGLHKKISCLDFGRWIL